MIFLSYCFEKKKFYKFIRSFWDNYQDGLLGAAAALDWSAVWFMAGVNEKVECFYTMLNFLLDTFVPLRRIKVLKGDRCAIGLTRVCSLRSTRGLLLVRFGMTILTG
jgi:hypothetical protein